MRVDTGVEQGDEITPYYDPMIAKLIVWDEHPRARAGAHAAGARAISHRRRRQQRRVPVPPGCVSGVRARRSRYRAHRARARRSCFPRRTKPRTRRTSIAALATLLREDAQARRVDRASGDPYSPWRMQRRLAAQLALRAQARLPLRRHGAHGGRRLRRGRVHAAHRRNSDCRTRRARSQRHAARRISAAAGSTRAWSSPARSAMCFSTGEATSLRASIHCIRRRGTRRRRRSGGADAGQGDRVARAAGREVAKGAPLLILEAMKMEHTITAPRGGHAQGVQLRRRRAGDRRRRARRLREETHERFRRRAASSRSGRATGCRTRSRRSPPTSRSS